MPQPLPTEPDTHNSLSLLRRLLVEHGRQHAGAYASALVLMAIGAGATATIAWTLKPVLNHMVEPDGFRRLRLLSFAVAGLFVVRGATSYLSLVILSRTGNRVVAAVQKRLFDHLLQQDISFLQERHSSEFMGRIALAANSVRDTLQTLVMSAGRDALTLIGLVIVMFLQDPVLALVALAIMPMAAYGLGRLVRTVRMLARRSFDGSTHILRTLQETLQGIRVVKSFNLENVMRARMDASIADVEHSANRAAIRMAMASPIADVVAGFAIALVLFYGSWRVTIASDDPGSFFSFVVAFLLAYEPGKRLARVHLEIQNGLANARLIFDVLDRASPDANHTGSAPLTITQAQIAYDNVHFAYRPDELVINGLYLIAHAGKTIALVGPSGAGKSTIAALLQRFHAPQSGRITIDGQDIAQVDLHALRDAIAFVPQDVFLFEGSVRDNIALGRPGSSDAQIEDAAKRADAHDFILAFRNGYDTAVGELGQRLSGGQRQRIAIARAMLKDAPILVLDEPTAALDPESERDVRRAIDRLRSGRTTIVIAHQLQTILSADVICVIEEGRMSASGTHQALIAQPGSYRNFFNAQFGDAVF